MILRTVKFKILDGSKIYISLLNKAMIFISFRPHLINVPKIERGGEISKVISRRVVAASEICALEEEVQSEFLVKIFFN